MARLLADGVDPERILLLTFTRRAAADVLARAAVLCRDRRAATRLWGGTFHAVAHRLLGGHAETLGLPARLSVLDQADARDLMDLLRHDHGLAGTTERFPRADTLVDVYSRAVNTGRPAREVIGAQFPWCDPHTDAILGLFRRYTVRKRAPVCWTSTTCCWPGAASRQPLLDLANVVRPGSHDLGLRLYADRAGDSPAGRPRLVRCYDAAAEARQVADAVLDAVEAGGRLREQAVLMRAAHHSDLLEIEPTARRVPFVKFGGLKFLEAAHVKDFLAGLRLLDNPADEIAWFRLLRLHDGIGPPGPATCSPSCSPPPATSPTGTPTPSPPPPPPPAANSPPP